MSLTATPRLSGASSVFSRSRSGSLMTRTNSLATPTPAVVAANAAASTSAASVGGGGGILREGYIMFYDTPTAEWLRVYMTLTHSTMSMQSTCSRFGRFVRPTTNLKCVSHFHCSLDLPEAPDRHIPILGLLTEKDELYIFRTPERRSMMDWCLHLREACPSVPWGSVEDMSILRRHFSPQLYGALFRPDLNAKGLVRTNACATIPPQPRNAIPQQANRRSSLSAGCPRRGPARRAAGGVTVASQMATARRTHADPQQGASTTDALEESKQTATAVSVLVPLSVVDSNTVGGISESRGSSARVSVSCAMPSTSLHQINNENIKPVSISSIGSSTGKAKSPLVVSLATAVPLNVAAPTPKISLADPVPTSLEKQLTAKVKDLRAELDAVSGRNIDLEIDNANISVRVLELEAEVVTMKDGIAEWRRRYQSLEQQLACQEEGFKSKLTQERADLVANMKEEVESQFAVLKARFAEREKQLEARIAELEKK